MDGQSFRFGNTPPTPAAKFISKNQRNLCVLLLYPQSDMVACPPKGGFVLAEIAMGAWMVFKIIL